MENRKMKISCFVLSFIFLFFISFQKPLQAKRIHNPVVMAITSWALASMAAAYIVSLLSKEPQEEVQELNQYINDPVHRGSLSTQLDSFDLAPNNFIYE